VKRLLALVVSLTFVGATAVAAMAAGTAPATSDKKMEKSGDMKSGDTKKMTSKTANGTVKSASPDSIVVAGKDKGKDAEWTFAVDGKTTVKRGGKSVAAGDLKPGDSVSVRYMDHEGKAVAQAVNVRSAAK
jgi:DUF4097 and DUF4098 domain-containing protein YvlB